MLEVSVLKIEDPGCFWVLIKGSSPFLDHELDYQKLNSAMNDFYNRMCQDAGIKPLMLEEGQVCVVYCQELKCWCRAIIKSIMSSAGRCLADCFLVDFAKNIPVRSKNIRVAVETFMQLPYRAKKFGLFCTKPVTLHIDVCEDSSGIVPAKKWDSAAVEYFQNLLRVTTHVEAKLCAVEEDTFEVYLYVTIKNEKVCVNDDLVAKNFACYVSPLENKILDSLEKSRLNIKSPSFSSKLNPALTLWPMFLQGKDSQGIITPHLSVLCQKPGEKPLRLAEKKEYDEKNGCVKLLQFLNPDPLRADGISDLQQLQKLKSGVQQPFVVLRNKIEPCLTIEMSPLSADLKKVNALQRTKFPGPSHTESYSWPPIARGYDVVVISHCGNDPMLYLPPVLTVLQTGFCYKSLPARNGPLAVIVCPGWKKAQFIFELLGDYNMSSRPLHPVLLTIGLHKDEAKNVKLPRGSDVIVTTPHSLLRLHQYQSLLFLRLCHLILDEVEILFSEANEQMFAILDDFKKSMEVEERESTPHQIVAVGVHWNKHIEHLAREFMNDPYIVVTAMEEAALYGRVQQVVHLCLESEKPSTLLQTLDISPSQMQKTLIFTCSEAETEAVYKGSTADQGEKRSKSVLLLTEKNACHAIGVLRYLERSDAKIPSELYEFTAGVLEAKENQKATQPLCQYLKAFGFCKDKRICPNRHYINPEIDTPRKLSNQTLPMCGYIKVIPFYILNATNYFGRIIAKHVDLYESLAAEMTKYFKESGNKTIVEKVEKLELYGFAEKTFVHRVQVLEISQKEDPWALDNVLVKFIDEGRTRLVTRDQLFHLPESFHTLPPQAVELIVCRVRPADSEMEWNPKVTRYIHHKIIGKLHDAKVILALGNTVWIDPMVHVTKLSNLKTSVIDYNVRAEILSMGMGVDNAEHTEQLKALYERAKMPACEETPFHPQIKWFQKDDAIILKIKLRNVKDYRCKYFRDRVIFSAWVGDKFYLADMELQANIVKDDCKCLITNEEPTITLAKERRESWCRLLRHKNPNVAFDFDHWEEREEEGHFSKVINSKSPSCKVAKVVEDSYSSSEDEKSDSE
ncbi:PREDICTED: putative ATP-dependent RNA helicase TDRD12 [Chrysochloris asiatica]|uniref:Putative ATP-dependent RNA helicase TDRD12 n=1 Tax=Chrysochloris asiatica TaxID=185453 RepID=A0A9B0TRP4_CHRAS|nr:PREDICTED: putative ATP-dependent RNA helicase TDRD12 [Chrysochloris asiatica]